jgi:hypothetical protein
LRNYPERIYVCAVTQVESSCRRCAAPQRPRAWGELNEEDREVVRRLPASAELSIEERAARRLWCVRCWHEEAGGGPREA